jgi:hypothetical protein
MLDDDRHLVGDGAPDLIHRTTCPLPEARNLDVATGIDAASAPDGSSCADCGDR